MKKFLFISPQPWGKLYLSKHNYAMALAEQGHVVYFLNPPEYKKNAGDFCFKVHRISDNLYSVDYQLTSILYTLRFKGRVFYDFYIRNKVIKKLNKLGPFDELWCFEPNVFAQFSPFQAKKKLLFIVDFHDNRTLKRLAKEADGIVTISKHILDYFSFINKPKLLLHHGLNSNFSKMATAKLNDRIAYQKGNYLKVAYIGNLLQGNRLDHGTLRLIIENHPSIQFHFYGPYQSDGNSLGSTINAELLEFVAFLKRSSNVFLHGVKIQSDLIKEIQQMDAFLTCYNYLTDFNKSSNCHKVIEYLSTGKVVVANRLFAYEDLRDLIEMPAELTNEKLPELFDKVIYNIGYYNSPEKQKARIAFALSNTYMKHINTLELFIQKAQHEATVL